MKSQGRIFTPYDVQRCLYDEARVTHFWTAIRNSVKLGDVIVDGGSGTGVLGLLAAQMGASRVYCVEVNPEFAAVIEQNAIRNDLQDQIIVINADATTVRLPEPVSVIVSEVMGTGFFYEPQLAIVKNLRTHLRPNGIVIPHSVDSRIELVRAQETLYGLRFTYDSRTKVIDDRSMTDRKTYLSVNFTGYIPDYIEARERLRALHSGTVNAVCFSSRLEFTPGVWMTEPTDFLLNPRIVYLDRPIHIQRDEIYEVRLRYTGGSSPLACKVDVRPASGQPVY